MKFLTFLSFLLLINCSQNDYPKLEGDAVWTISRYDQKEEDNYRKIKVKFRNNGYAYEQNTILRYSYATYFSRNIFEFNNKSYKILRWKENEILLHNTTSNTLFVLRRD